MSFPWYPEWVARANPEVDPEDFTEASCAAFNLDHSSRVMPLLGTIAGAMNVVAGGKGLPNLGGADRLLAEFALNCALYAEFVEYMPREDGNSIEDVRVTQAGTMWLHDYAAYVATVRARSLH